MVIQTVSTDRRSFVAGRGIKDGVVKGQEIIFANESVSILCKAIEVNRNYSLWVPVNKSINIPFKKEEIISYNSHAYGNVALDIVADVSNLIPKIDYNEVYKRLRSENNISAKVSYNRGLSQSSSDVSAESTSNRVGYAFSAEYDYRFMPEFELNFGGRIDNEVYRLAQPELDISTSRVMATFGATYHLMGFTSNENNFYVSLIAGIGQSKTTVSEESSSGMVTLLPEARVGFLMPFTTTYAMIFEGSVESLSAKEKFVDGTEQTTNMLNVKLSVGLRF